MSEEQAKLEAQAHAMARLLLKLEWVRDTYEPGLSCPACEHRAPHDPGAFYSEKYPELIGHKPSCELVRVLRDMGYLNGLQEAPKPGG